MAEETKTRQIVILVLVALLLVSGTALVTYFLTSRSESSHFEARLREEKEKRAAVELCLDSVSREQKAGLERAALWLLRSDSAKAVAQASARRKEELKQVYETAIDNVSRFTVSELDSLFAVHK